MCLVAQLCPTLCSMDCSPPGSSVHGILQARILECVATSFSRGSYPARDQTLVSCTAGGFFTSEPPGKPFDCVDDNKMWKILLEMRTPDHLTCLLRNVYAGQEATVRTGHGLVQFQSICQQWTGSKLGKEYIKAVYCHPAYLTYMQSTS